MPSPAAVKLGRLVTRTAAQGTPIAGVVGEAWSPAGGLLLYWFESVLVLGATLWLLARWTKRHGSPAEARASGIETRDVALVHGGAFGIFGLFFAGLLFVFVSNGHLPADGLLPVVRGLPWIALFVALELVIDLVRLRRATAADLVRRVDDGNLRFFLFWAVGFFGTLGAMLFGRPMLIFGLFATLKILLEVLAVLERTTRPAVARAAAT
jgi:hypothetical protein